MNQLSFRSVVPVKIPRKSKKQPADYGEPVRRERISATRTRVCGIEHSAQNDATRSAFLDGLHRARQERLSVADMIDAAERVGIDDMLSLMRRWCAQNTDLAEVYAQQIQVITSHLLDIQESETPQ